MTVWRCGCFRCTKVRFLTTLLEPACARGERGRDKAVASARDQLWRGIQVESLLSQTQAIAYAWFSDDIAGATWLWFELAAQIADVDP